MALRTFGDSVDVYRAPAQNVHKLISQVGPEHDPVRRLYFSKSDLSLIKRFEKCAEGIVAEGVIVQLDGVEELCSIGEVHDLDVRLGHGCRIYDCTLVNQSLYMFATADASV